MSEPSEETLVVWLVAVSKGEWTPGSDRARKMAKAALRHIEVSAAEREAVDRLIKYDKRLHGFIASVDRAGHDKCEWCGLIRAVEAARAK